MCYCVICICDLMCSEKPRCTIAQLSLYKVKSTFGEPWTDKVVRTGFPNEPQALDAAAFRDIYSEDDPPINRHVDRLDAIFRCVPLRSSSKLLKGKRPALRASPDDTEGTQSVLRAINQLVSVLGGGSQAQQVPTPLTNLEIIRRRKPASGLQELSDALHLPGSTQSPSATERPPLALADLGEVPSPTLSCPTRSSPCTACPHVSNNKRFALGIHCRCFKYGFV